jgi:hypothetical protein
MAYAAKENVIIDDAIKNNDTINNIIVGLRYLYV